MKGTFRVIDVPQRSEAWFQARLGRLTASRAADMLATIRSGEAAARRNLRVQLVLERITGQPHERGYQSQAMLDGIEREADAAGLYEALTGQILQTSGFLAHTTYMAGCSLDGYIGDFEGIVEAKCPIPATHLSYLQTGQIPNEYKAQILHSLWITGAEWCDWLSYQPAFPESIRMKLVRVVRDERAVADYEGKALAFLEDVNRETEAVKALGLKELEPCLQSTSAAW